MSVVSIVKTPGGEEEQISASVRQAVELAGGTEDLINPGDLVLIKPNLVAVPASRLTGAVTRWEVVKAVADLVKEAGGNPVIAESAAAGVDTEKVIAACDYERLRNAGYQVIDLKRTKRAKLDSPQGVVFKTLGSWELVTKADVVISVPVMKTHDQTEVTLGLKNLKGLIDDNQKKEFHRQGLLEGVVDLVLALKAKLTVIDATIAQEGLGPIFGKPVEMGLIIVSKDLVAADAVGGMIMGYPPREVMITVKAAERGLGEMDLEKIEVKGVPISQVQRRFLRSAETSIEGLPPFHLVLAEGACTGCRNTVISAIMDMKSQNLQGYLKGKYIVAGPYEVSKIPPNLKKDHLILVGVCTKNLEELGKYVPGCPPNNIFVVKAVIGEEKRVKRRYATEEGADQEQ